jgi:SAM-dependent methyltransferase
MFARSVHFYDAVYSFKDYVAEAERVHALIQESVPNASSLLDVACGTGRHLEQFRRWYEVEGVDLDEGSLKIARARLGNVPLHVADMTSFALGRTFDAVTCLFSAVGYVGTTERLAQALARMASHLNPGGLLIVEPWIAPDKWVTGAPHLLTVDQPNLKIARMNVSSRTGRLAVLDFFYLVATPAGVEHFTERHEIALFTDAEYRQGFEDTGLAVEYDEVGLIGRGLYLGRPA